MNVGVDVQVGERTERGTKTQVGAAGYREDRQREV